MREQGARPTILADALVRQRPGRGGSTPSWRLTRARDLEGKEYEPLFDFVQPRARSAWYVVCDDYVTLTDGTGVVHIAPAFGEDDAKVGRKYDLPLVQLVDAKGQMTE